MNGSSMKRDNRISLNDVRPEYDFASMKGGICGKYVKRYRAGTNLVLLDPEVAAAFPSDAAVNEALSKAQKVAAEKVAPLTGGIKLPGM